MGTAARVFSVLLCAFLLAPVAPIIYQAFRSTPLYDSSGTFTFNNFVRLFQDGEFGPATLNTVYFVGLALILAVSLGVVLTLIIERIELPFRRTLRLLVISPLFISPLILAFAWSMIYGPGGYVSSFLKFHLGFGLPNLNSLPGMSLVAGIAQVPISYLYLSAAVRNIPDVYERSARTAGASRFTAIRTILLPLLLPAILYCALLNVMLLVDLLAVPLILGEPARILVLSTFLYTKGAISAQMDYGIIAAAAVVMMLVIQLVIWLQRRWMGDTRRFVAVGAKTSAGLRRQLGARGWVISALLFLFVVIILIAPTVFLVLRSFTTVLTPLLPLKSVLTLENYEAILSFEQYIRSITNSLIISTVGGFAAVALTFTAAVFAYRSTPGVRRFIEQVAILPRAVPGLVVGLGFFYGVFLIPGGHLLKNSLFILAFAFMIRNFPTGFGAVSPTFIQIGDELDRAARISGAGRWRAIKDITLPLTKGALAGAFVLYFVYFLKEYSSAAFLFGPGTEVIGTTMLELNFSGYLGPLAALACIELVILIPFSVLVYGRQ
jgi:iron(III) transport system permease protein